MSINPKPRSVTAQTFSRDVIQRSAEVVVLVDFWADWCQPCHMLSPILERIAEDYAGQVEVVKVNADEEQALTHQFQVRSLPTVILVSQGQIADGFVGVRPEEEIRDLLAPYLTEPQAEEPVESEEARLQRLEMAHAEKPDDTDVTLQLAEALATSGASERAEALLQTLPVTIQMDLRTEKVRALGHFHRAAANAPAPETLAARLREDPTDLHARHQWAAHRVLAGDYAGAAPVLLEIVQRDRSFDNDLGRRALLALFTLAGPKSEVTQQYRRRLATLVL